MTMTDPLALSGNIDQAELTGDLLITPNFPEQTDGRLTLKSVSRPITPDDAFRRTISPFTITEDLSVKSGPIRFATSEEIAQLRAELTGDRPITKDDAIAQLRADLADLAEHRDELLSIVVEKKSELAELRSLINQQDATITDLRSQIDKLTTAALAEPTQPQVDVDQLLQMINTQHQIIAKLDQHLAIALGMADYKKMLGQ